MKYPLAALKRSNASHSAVSPRWFNETRAIEKTKEVTKVFDTLGGMRDFTVDGQLNLSSRVYNKIEAITNSIDDGDIDLNYYDRKAAITAATLCYVIGEVEENLMDDDTIGVDIKDPEGRTLIKAHTSVGVAIKKLIEWATTINSQDLLRKLKDAQNLLATKEKYKIVFSTNPWDILTMSMRGIESCMEWGSSHCAALVGSVLCPYVGVIYSTTPSRKHNKNTYGTYMEHRSVVRLVKKNTASNRSKFYLCVEGAYPKGSNDEDDDYYDDDSPNTAATEMFMKTLEKRIKNNKKIAGVISAENSESRNYYVPLTNIVRNLNDENRTYFDGQVRYR